MESLLGEKRRNPLVLWFTSIFAILDWVIQMFTSAFIRNSNTLPQGNFSNNALHLLSHSTTHIYWQLPPT